jgi:hypothetical protein
MSTGELKRAGVLARVVAGTLTLGSAATLMGVELPAGEAAVCAVSTPGGRGPAAWQRRSSVESGDIRARAETGAGLDSGEVQRRE